MRFHKGAQPAIFIFILFISTQTHAQISKGISFGSDLLNVAMEKSSLKKVYQSQKPKKVLILDDSLAYVRTSKEALTYMNTFGTKYASFIQRTNIVEDGLEKLRQHALNLEQAKTTDDWMLVNLNDLERDWPNAPIAQYRSELHFYDLYEKKRGVYAVKEGERKAAMRSQVQKQIEDSLELEKQQALLKEVDEGRESLIHPKAKGKISVTGPGEQIAETEYDTQATYMQESSHGHRVQFTGTKRPWINELATYIIACQFEPQNTKTEGNVSTFTYTKDCVGCTAPQKIVLKQTFDPLTGITTAVQWTAPSTIGAGLYIAYYELEDRTEAEIKNKPISSNFKGDRVNLTWQAAQVTVKITPNPDYE